MVFSFTTLSVTDLDKVNRITLSTYLSRRAQSPSNIFSISLPREVYATASHWGNPLFASSNTQNQCCQTFRFLTPFNLLLWSLPLKPKALIPVVRNKILFLETLWDARKIVKNMQRKQSCTRHKIYMVHHCYVHKVAEIFTMFFGELYKGGYWLKPPLHGLTDESWIMTH